GGDAPPPDHVPGVHGLQAGEDPEDRGLPRPVRPHDPDPRAVEDLEVEAFEDGPRPEGLGRGGEGDEGHGPVAPEANGRGVASVTGPERRTAPRTEGAVRSSRFGSATPAQPGDAGGAGRRRPRRRGGSARPPRPGPLRRPVRTPSPPSG